MRITCSIGRFIGKKGANLKALLSSVPGTFIQFRGRRNEGRLVVYGKDRVALDRIKDAIVRKEKSINSMSSYSYGYDYE